MSWQMQMEVLLTALAETQQLETAPVRLGQRHLNVPVARTPRQWQQGLRAHDGTEMLFVMPEGSRFPFHLAGVASRILLAFFDAEGQLVELGQIDGELPTYRPVEAYRYVLEIADPQVSLALLRDLSGGLEVGSVP